MKAWAREPLFIFTAGYTGGLLVAGLLFESPAALPLLAAALVLGLAAILHRAWRPIGFRGAALLAAGLLAAAAVPELYRAAVPSHHLLARIPFPRVNLIGRLSAPVETREGIPYKRARMDIAAERLFVRGVEVPVKGTVRLTLAGVPRQRFHPGDRILVRRARLQAPVRDKNPGGFDYREFLRLRGVHATGYISPDALELLERPAGFSWRRALFRVRDRMRDFLRNTLPAPAARLMEAMALGTREQIPPDLRESFQRAGAMHLLAISGLHVGFISAFFFFFLHAIFRRLPPGLFPTHPAVITPTKAAAICTIPVVVLFALMTGARVSTIRAAIMVVAYLCGRIMERPSGPIHTLTLAALILLLAEPGSLWDAGFQLSFLAVGAILLVAPRLPAPPPESRIWQAAWWRIRFLQLVILQVVILLALLPLTIWHFHEIHPAGLFSNLLLIPIASIAVPWTFVASGIAAALSAFTESANQVLAVFAFPLRLMAEGMLRVAEGAGAIPGGVITVPPAHPTLSAGYLLLLAAALGARGKRLRRLGWLGAAVFVLPILWAAYPPAIAPAHRLSLSLPAAGRVDAFFLRLPDGRGFAFEGSHTRGRFDPWKRVLAPALLREGERNWDTLVTLVPAGKKSRAAESLAAGFRLRTVHGVSPSQRKEA
ncbi:MAG: ComEC/Rec2 family competence protein, partial [bacterium]|nr:ComEC/Rec2 family competence protein [bacterium]